MSDTVIYRARRIITMDPDRPSADAVAVRGGRFVAVGSLEEVVSAVGADHKVSDRFAEQVMLPGLIDQHLHPMLGATTLTTEIIAPEDWNLPHRVHHAAGTAVEYDARLQEAHRSLHDGEWLYSWGWHALWHGPLDRGRLDRLAGERPVAVWQRSCHEWILNTAALDRIGLTEEMTKGHGLASEQIDWDRGHFWENGWMTVLSRHLMPGFMTRERFTAGLQQLIEYLHMNGVTAINEPGIYWRSEPWDLYQEILGHPDVPFESTFLVEGRTQPVRGLGVGEFVSDAAEQVARGRGGKVRVLENHVKLFADGAIISQLMQMKDPYLDREGRPDPDHHGEWMMPPDQLRTVFDAYWDADWQVHVHVNGDLGLEVLLGIIEDAQHRRPRLDHRTVVVHFANSTEEQVDRIARLGAIVSANPYYPVGFADKYSEWGLGPERADVMVRAASVLARGIPLSFHSDLPMCPGDPMLMASFAVNRVTASGRVAGPEQRISVHEALSAVTIGAAHSWRRESELGSIEPGKIANMTVLDSDPYGVDPADLGRIPIRATMFEGRIHDIDPDLVEQRIAAGSDHGRAAAESPRFVTPDHGCGCEVASFVAGHMTSGGWAA
jgi:predicted amidohydrolase YtcJ